MNRNCQNCKKDFLIEADDKVFYELVKVPEPTFCPDCRLIRRLSVRNERALYKRDCGLCKKSLISIYSPESPFTVYCLPCWWSDKWDPMISGRDYDFSRSFFEQFVELAKATPMPALTSTYQNLINSDYTNLVTNLKNCYLIFNSDYSENCSYGTEIEHSKECYDNASIDGCELCYQNVNCENCFRTFFSTDCKDSHNVWFSKNLSGCTDCFGCVNLRGKNYHIFNEPYTKEDYEKKIKELYDGSHKSIEEILKKTEGLFENQPNKYMHERQNKNVSGDYITNSTDTHYSFMSTGARNCKYCLWLIVKPSNDCWDYIEYGDGAERVYETALGGSGLTDIKFCSYCFINSARLEYSSRCYSSEDLFGCVGLRKKQYCIFNKQYSKEEYEELTGRIIKQMAEVLYTDKKGREYGYGEFAPTELSPFAYNETTAQEYAPLTKEEALEQGYQWRETVSKNHKEDISWKDLPEKISEVDDEILKKVILCKAWDENSEEANEHACSKAYRIKSDELGFYRQMNIPIPRECPNTRHFIRIQRRNPYKLWDRSCMCSGGSSDNGKYTNSASAHSPHEMSDHCPATFKTAYSPEKKDIIYCKECFEAEVI